MVRSVEVEVILLKLYVGIAELGCDMDFSLKKANCPIKLSYNFFVTV